MNFKLKTKTLGVLNAVYGAICCFLFLIQSGAIVFRSFMENDQYTLKFFQVWQVVIFVLMLFSIVLLVLNIKRRSLGNKRSFYVLNGCIIVNIIGTIVFNAVAVFSVLIVVLGVVLCLTSNDDQDQFEPIVRLKRR